MESVRYFMQFDWVQSMRPVYLYSQKNWGGDLLRIYNIVHMKETERCVNCKYIAQVWFLIPTFNIIIIMTIKIFNSTKRIASELPFSWTENTMKYFLCSICLKDLRLLEHAKAVLSHWVNNGLSAPQNGWKWLQWPLVVENQNNKVQKDLETQAKGLISAPRELLFAVGNSGKKLGKYNKVVFPLVLFT